MTVEEIIDELESFLKKKKLVLFRKMIPTRKAQTLLEANNY